ncbi:HEAT repeat domain-containing protein [Actinoplanes teichomyceticus]|uniref:HEAT repeat domain-containing protein n=1 Tax=Actinoplanes teichomyceticus TaxID=1867 RepID=UPI003555E095
MNPTPTGSPQTRLRDALSAPASSVRLRAALAAGSSADEQLLDTLVQRCAVEPDFFVRDMLTWALTRLPAHLTVPRLRAHLHDQRPQARSQALHTLSKIGDRDVYPAITGALLHDGDDEVARSAWRAAVALVPDDRRARLAAELARELGRGDRRVQRSLSRALVTLGESGEPLLHAALAGSDPVVRAHAHATLRLLHDPDTGFDQAADEATRILALGHEDGEAAAC